MTERLHNLDLGPVGLELVGDDLRHGGPDLLAHFGTMAGDFDRAVWLNRDPKRWRRIAAGDFFERTAGRLSLDSPDEGNTKHERAGGFDEAATAERGEIEGGRGIRVFGVEGLGKHRGMPRNPAAHRPP